MFEFGLTGKSKDDIRGLCGTFMFDGNKRPVGFVSEIIKRQGLPRLMLETISKN